MGAQKKKKLAHKLCGSQSLNKRCGINFMTINRLSAK